MSHLCLFCLYADAIIFIYFLSDAAILIFSLLFSAAFASDADYFDFILRRRYFAAAFRFVFRHYFHFRYFTRFLSAALIATICQRDERRDIFSDYDATRYAIIFMMPY